MLIVVEAQQTLAETGFEMLQESQVLAVVVADRGKLAAVARGTLVEVLHDDRPLAP